MITSIKGVKAAAEKSAGSRYFFSRATRRGFSSRISSTVYPVAGGGAVFVTSERDNDTHNPAWDGKRRYTVHFISDAGEIRSLTYWGHYGSLSGAHGNAAWWAAGNLNCLRCGEPAGSDYHIIGASITGEVTCDRDWDERLR